MAKLFAVTVAWLAFSAFSVQAPIVQARTAKARDAQSPAVQPVTQADPYVPVPGGKLLADNNHVYRVMFEAKSGPASPDQLTPAVNMAGSELNTMAAHGVKRKNVKFVVVFHTRPADDALLDNTHYRAKYGIDNPNLAALTALKREGVELYVCGQELQADGVALDSVTHDVTIAEDGVVVLMTYGGMGYTHLTF